MPPLFKKGSLDSIMGGSKEIAATPNLSSTVAAQFCHEHMPQSASFIPAKSPLDKVVQGSAIDGQGTSNEFTGGQQNKMSNSNEKQE